MIPPIQHFNRPTSTRPPSLVSVTIVSALVGLATGAAGFSLLKSWYPVDFTVDGAVVGRSTVTIKTEQSLVAAVTAISSQLYGVYQGNAAGNEALSQWRSDKDYIGAAVPVTSDGWLMLPPNLAITTPAEVIVNQKAYPIIDTYKDSLTGLVFIKISATNLHPIAFAKADQVAAGTTLVYQKMSVAGTPVFNRVLVSSGNQIDTSTKNSQIHSTEAIDTWATIDNDSAASDILFTPDGSLAGVTYTSGKALQVTFIQAAVDKLLTRAVYKPLGFTYVDLYRLPQAQTTGKSSVGALVYNSGRPAVTINSPAYKAGLKAGDIILAVDGETVGYDMSLMELLSMKKSGDIVNLKIERQGQTQDIVVQL
jgi:serine protease Do